jgi:alpha/beta superfamily hydrolase
MDDPGAQVLVIFGDRDEFTGETQYETWARAIAENGKGTVQVKKVEDATHFWHGRAGRALVRTVEDWLS